MTLMDLLYFLPRQMDGESAYNVMYNHVQFYLLMCVCVSVANETRT